MKSVMIRSSKSILCICLAAILAAGLLVSAVPAMASDLVVSSPNTVIAGVVGEEFAAPAETKSSEELEEELQEAEKEPVLLYLELTGCRVIEGAEDALAQGITGQPEGIGFIFHSYTDTGIALCVTGTPASELEEDVCIFIPENTLEDFYGIPVDQQVSVVTEAKWSFTLPEVITDPSETETDTDQDAETDTASDSETELSAAEGEDVYPSLEYEYDENDDPSPQKINEAIGMIADGLAKLKLDPNSAKTFTGILTRIASGKSVIGGGIAILQLLGIIQDPTLKGIQDILTLLNSQNQKLQDMSQTIAGIASSIKDLQVDSEMKWRALNAGKSAENWAKFNTNYLEAMEKYLRVYKGWVDDETSYWANGVRDDKTPYERYDLYAYYTIINDQKTQTYSTTGDKNLVMSDNGEGIVKKYTVGLPKSYIDDALQGYKYNIDTYHEDITALLGEAILRAIQDDALICTDYFRNKWEAASVDEKSAIVNETAAALLNSALYISSTRAVNGSENHRDEARRLIAHMESTWENTFSSKGGIASQIDGIKMTYCFEGEVKDQINEVYDSLSVIDTYYGMLSMTVASQLQNTTKEVKSKARTNWCDGVHVINANKAKAVKGSDNYCYLTDSLVDVKQYTVSADSTFNIHYKTSGIYRLRIDGKNATQWSFVNQLGVPVSELNIMNGVYSKVLYLSYVANHKSEFKDPTDKKEIYKKYKEYLKTTMKTLPRDFSGLFLTSNKIDSRDFSLSDGLSLQCRLGFSVNREDFTLNPHYFDRDGYYDVMKDLSRAKYTMFNKKVIGETFNAQTAVLTPENILTARATFAESHCYWNRDEPWFFVWYKDDNGCYSKGSSKSLGGGNKEHLNETRQPVFVLECSNVKKNEEVVEPAEEKYEDIYDPDALVDESAYYIQMDTTITPHENERVITREEWDEFSIDYITLNATDEEMITYVRETIDGRIEEAAEEGKNISLSESEKDALAVKLTAMIMAAKDETDNNKNIGREVYIDPFGLYENKTAMKKLAQEALPDCEFATDGSLMDPVENMITAAFCEPTVYLSFEETSDGYELVPTLLYDITPALLVWCEETQEVKRYKIDNDVIEKLGLKMKIRISAAGAGENTTASIVHYDDIETMNVIETKKAAISGSGSDKYCEILVSKCSPFSIEFTNEKGSGITAAKTGDSFNMTFYYVFALAALFVIAAGVVVRRRRNH